MSHKKAKRERQDERGRAAGVDTASAFRGRRTMLLIGGAVCTVLAIPFASQIATRAGDDTYDWIKERIRTAEAKAASRLSTEYPDGYQCFGITSKNTIIAPQTISRSNVVIDWPTAAVLAFSEKKITIRLPDAHLEGVRLEGIVQSGPNSIGRWGTMLSVFGWQSYVEIIEATPAYVIAALGYKKV